MEAIFIFVFGLVIGSFLNVCIYRIPRNESLSYPPSHCAGCGKRIKPYDLVPVLSYILLRGKCRNCGEKISIRYPLIELTTGALFWALYIEYGISFELVKFIVLISFLIVIALIDLESMDVYEKTTIPAIILGIIFMFWGHHLYGGIMEYVYGGLLGGGIIAIIIIFTKGMGWGDAQICLLCGMFLGLRYTLAMLFFSFVIGGITGISLMLLKIKSRRDYIPFGPFVALAAVIMIYFGEGIMRWYISLR